MSNYIPPRVTFVGSDPKIPALRKAIKRVSDLSPFGTIAHHRRWKRFAALWQARNRRTRVLMFKVRDANAR